MAETAGSVQFGLTLSPLDRALQPSTEETLEWVEEESNNKGQTDGGGKGGCAWCEVTERKKWFDVSWRRRVEWRREDTKIDKV